MCLPSAVSRRSPLLLCQECGTLGTSLRRRMRPSGNKGTNTPLPRKGKKQSQSLSYIMSVDRSGPMQLPYDTRDPRPREECDRGVCGEVLSPAAAGQDICWMWSGRVTMARGLGTLCPLFLLTFCLAISVT